MAYAYGQNNRLLSFRLPGDEVDRDKIGQRLSDSGGEL